MKIIIRISMFPILPTVSRNVSNNLPSYRSKIGAGNGRFCESRLAVVGRGRVKTPNLKVLRGRFTIADARQSRCRSFSQADFKSA